MINGDYEMVVAPDGYPGKRYRGRYCYEHHLRFWEAYGYLPGDGEIIHHKDGNKHNNDVNNLELLTHKEHVSLHHRTGRKSILMRCPACGELFVKAKRQTHLQKGGQATYCSKDCANKANSLRKFHPQELVDNIKRNVIMELFV